MRFGTLVLSMVFAVLVPLLPAGADSHDPRGRIPAVPNQTDALPVGADEFDFTIGRWNIQQVGGGTATDVIKSFGGVAITEKMRAPGFSANTVTVFDATTGKWTQTYFDNQGTYAQQTGGREGEEFVLVGPLVGSDGVERLSRLRYINISRRSFDQVGELSPDGGATWQESFRLQFRKAS